MIVLNTAPPSDNPNSRYTAEIVPKVYLGNVTVANDGALMKSMHMTDVIALGRLATELKRHDGINYVPFEEPVDDAGFELFDMLDEIADAIRSVTKKRRGRVMVIDATGVSLSPAVVMAYLMREHAQDLQQSLDTIRKQLTFVHPNSGFMEQLADYDMDLQEERKGK